MNMLKNIIVFLLLIAVTLSVVFTPQIISGQREENILSNITYHSYSASQRPKLSRSQVARLYYNRKVGIGYNSVFDTNDENLSSLDIDDLINVIFGKDEAICSAIKGKIKDSDMIYYSRSNSLININNQPTALNFISCDSKTSPYLYIRFEEKTKTVIMFACCDFIQEFANVKEVYVYIEKVDAMIKDYCENQLNMSENEYSCIVECSNINTDKNQKAYANINISFELLQSGDKIVYEEDVFTIKDTH